MNKKQKVAIVTGGTSGIGFAIAQKFVENGIVTVIVSSTDKKLKEASDKLKMINRDLVWTIRADVKKSNEINLMVENVLNKYSQIDYLVNSAGVSIHGPFSELSERDWDEVVDTNLKGTFLCCKAVWIQMLRQNGGHIINISSASGMSGYTSGSIYCASKFGVNGLLEALAMEGQDLGIKVSNICPGQVDTGIWNPNDQEVNKARENMLSAKSIGDLVFYIVSRPQNEHFRNVVIHPFEIQPFLKGRNRGPGGKFPKELTKNDKSNKTFRI